MSIVTGVLGFGRAQTESRFTETLDFYRLTEIVDKVTLKRTEHRQLIHEDIEGQIAYVTLTVSDRSQATQQPAVQQLVAKVAVGSTPNVKTDDYCEVTASTADPTLVGRQYRVSARPQSGQVTAHRYPVTEIS